MLSTLRTTFLIPVLAVAPAWGEAARRTYLVELEGEPMAALARPSAIRTPQARARQTSLRWQRTAVAEALTARDAQVLTTLENVLNAVIVSVPENRAAALREIPGVRGVYADCEIQFASDKAMEMNGIAEAWMALGGRDTVGAGVKVAILDSGIVADHPAFQDKSMKAPQGYPRFFPAANEPHTSGKIIVARQYASLLAFRDPLPTDTVADMTGHGTAVASIIAGVPHQTPYGMMSGIAPKAWLGVYVVTGGTSITKALDDAVADGMDIANMSFMFVNGPVEDVRSALRAAVDRARQAGLILVTPTGPLGPQRATLMDPPISPDVLTVGGTPNSRLYAGAITFGGGAARQAFASSNHWFMGSLENPDRVAGPAADIVALDGTGNACTALPANSLTGRIAVAGFAGCTPEVKLKNLEAAGAMAAIFYTANAATAPARFLSGTAALGGVVVGFNDGRALRDAIAQGPVNLNVQFDGVEYPLETNLVAPYSGRGPTFDHRIKPDLVAVGDPRYVAAQKTTPAGALYSPSGYGTRIGTQTVSFAVATVSGALAALMSKRPGLTESQYRSLIVNSAKPLAQADGQIARVVEGGAGELNLIASLRNTLAVYPTSLSFGITAQNVSQHRALALTNLGAATETYTLRTVPFDWAPPLKLMTIPSTCRVTDQACIDMGSDTLTVTVEPGKTETIYPRWFAINLPPDEYQGIITITGTEGHGVTTVVPYWLGVPSGVPATARQYVTGFLADPTPYSEYWGEPMANLTFPGTEGYLFFLVTDKIGIAINDPAQLQFRGEVVAGNGIIGTPAPIPGSWGAVHVPVRLGPAPGVNTFRVQFGSTPPITVSVTSVARP